MSPYINMDKFTRTINTTWNTKRLMMDFNTENIRNQENTRNRDLMDLFSIFYQFAFEFMFIVSSTKLVCMIFR